jgi:hypothetical protein
VISGLAVLATVGLAVWDRRNRRAGLVQAASDTDADANADAG